jgi:DNA-3-methyladenine glycosylase II
LSLTLFPEDHIAGLTALDTRFAQLVALMPDLSWRRRPNGFEGLFRMIVEQQLSVAAANTILGRVVTGLGGSTPQAVLAAEDETLRSYGLSRPKISYAKNLARAVVEGELDFATIDLMDSEAAIAKLTALKGIGRWSAEVYLMFCAGHADLFPGGDIALREALGWFAGLDERPPEIEIARLTSHWSPHRTLASHVLWRWYGAVKRGEMQRVLT